MRPAALLSALLLLGVAALSAAGQTVSQPAGGGADVAKKHRNRYGENPCTYAEALPAGYYGKHKKHCKERPDDYNEYPGPEEPKCTRRSQTGIGYKNLLRSNDTFRSGVWGTQVDKNSEAIFRVLPAVASSAYAAARADAGGWAFPGGSGYGKFKAYSNAPDIPTLHPRGDKLYMINHFEFGQPANMYLSELKQARDGKLSVMDTQSIDDSKQGGMWFLCSGTITPWGSHMGAEEYPADCRLYQQYMLAASCTANTNFNACGWVQASAADAYGAMGMGRHFGQGIHPISDQDYGVNKSSPDIIAFEQNLGFGSQTVLDRFRRDFNCYNYGSSPEVMVDRAGDTTLTKWKTLGRISHEAAIVMPDLKTVYTTDDGTNCVLLKFVADRRSDLSSGTLFAAKLTAQGVVNETQAQFAVTWIRLGWASQAELDGLVASKPEFSDIFETTAAIAVGTLNGCPAGYAAANTPSNAYLSSTTNPASYTECLKVKPGMEKAAAFLETRRYASMLGATAEFEKEEGITLNAEAKELYVAYTRITRGMTADGKYSNNGPGDLAMPPNSCGTVFSYKLDDKFSATSARALIYGTPIPVDADGNKCAVSGISNPDNIHYFNGILLIAEDTADHVNNVLWAYDLADKSLTRILSSPRYAEVSGIYSNYVGKHAYITLAMQHPEDTSEGAVALDLPTALEQRSYAGYIGPLDAGCLRAGAKPVFAGIAAASTLAEKKAVLSTDSVTYVW